MSTPHAGIANARVRWTSRVMHLLEDLHLLESRLR